MTVTGTQVFAAWVAILAQQFLPWPLNHLIGFLLVFALVPSLVHTTFRVRAARKARKAA